MPDVLGEALRQAAERLFDGRNYSHAPIWRQIKDLSVEQALWRPSPGRHCIWEIVRHVAFWKRHFMDKLASRPTPPLDQDWRLPPRTDAPAWAAELEEFQAVQRAWVETYATFTREALLTPTPTAASNAWPRSSATSSTKPTTPARSPICAP